MKRFRLPVVFLGLTVIWLASPLTLHAAVTGLKVKIEGQQKEPANIAGTYTTEADSAKSYEIKAQASGNARVEAGDQPDYLRLHNAVITAKNDGVTGHIYFWVQLDAPPNGTVQEDVLTNGSLLRKIGFIWKGAVGDWIQVGGYVQSPVTDLNNGTGGTWWCITNPGDPPPCPPSHDHTVNLDTQGTISKSDTMDISGVDNVPYLLKGEIWFYLDKTGDKLTLNNGGGVVVQASAGGGDRPTTRSSTGGAADSGQPSCPKCCTMCCMSCAQ
jgi:hypothetical protein